MTLNYVTLTLDLYDGQGNYPVSGTATFTPSAVLTDAGAEVIGQQPVTAVFHAAGPPSVSLLATDNSGPVPAGWTWSVSFSGIAGAPAAFSFFLAYANGASQSLSTLVPVSSGTAFQAYTPLPVYAVPAPTGLTAADTPAVAAVIARLATAGGNGTLLFGDGTYQVDSNALVIRSCSNFAVRSTGATVIAQAPNRSALPNNVAGDLFVIADCTDFRVEGLTLDGLRDTVAPMTVLTASASSGQPSVTVAAAQAARYQAGQRLAVFGGLGTADSNLSDGFADGVIGANLHILSITPGGGSGGGDLITFSANLANSYTQLGSTAFSDGFGPYAYNGAYLTPYQTGYQASVAGRTLTGEDQQNGLHLLNCQRFVIDRVTARNLWESPVKCGSGESATQLTDGCSQGTITNCSGYHGYDQGISLWLSNRITVQGCVLNAAGWAGISMTASDECSVTGNQVSSSYYRIPSDNNSGCGIAIEGGRHNVVKGNVIETPWSDGVRLTGSPIGFASNHFPTLAAFLAGQTAAGTSVQLSSTTGIQAGGLFSILDGERTEALTVATVVDSTHVTFSTAIRFSHASGVTLGNRMGQENSIEGNTITGPQYGGGVLVQGSVRNRIAGNTITGWGLASGSTASGIVMAYTQVVTGVYLGGDGSAVEGNTLGGGLGGGVSVDSIGGLAIRGNWIYGLQSNQPGLQLKGITNSLVADNHIANIENGAGIFVQAGTLSSTVPARCVIRGNVIERTSNEGIIATAGDSLVFAQNVVNSTRGHAGINLRGVTRSLVDGNTCSSNASAGIELEDQGGTFCLYNRVTGNTCREDGTGINVTTGGAQTQAHGIVEAGTSDKNLFTGNECDANTSDQLTTVGASSVTHYNILSGTISA